MGDSGTVGGGSGEGAAERKRRVRQEGRREADRHENVKNTVGELERVEFSLVVTKKTRRVRHAWILYYYIYWSVGL